VLSGDELRWLWLACDEVEEPYHSIFRLLALSGQRLNEVAGMRREELRDDGMWHLPGSRTKNHLAHVVPLPPLAQSIIAAVPPGQNQFVFTTSAGRPPTHWSKAKSKLDAAMLALARKECGPDAVIEPWRLHDLRRGFVTGLVEIGVPPHVVEQVVNHISGTRAGVAGVYDKSQLLPERRAALQRWAAHVERVVSGAAAVKVVPLHGGR
jgi:integrase